MRTCPIDFRLFIFALMIVFPTVFACNTQQKTENVTQEMESKIESPPQAKPFSECVVRSTRSILKGEKNNELFKRLVEKKRRVNDSEFRALLPLLAHQIVESSRDGSLYLNSKKQPEKVYVVIPTSLAVLGNSEISAELIGVDGKSLGTWTLWDQVFTNSTYSFDDESWGNPSFKRSQLADNGLLLDLSSTGTEKKILLARIPLYPPRDQLKE